MLKEILSFEKQFKWLAKHKGTLGTILIVLGTISFAFNTSFQSQKDEELANLIYEIGNVGISYGSYTANTADIMLYRSIAADCKNLSLDTTTETSCVSNASLLETALSQRDLQKANNSDWINLTTTSIQKDQADMKTLNEDIQTTEFLGLLFFVLAIWISTLRLERKDS